MRGIGMVIHVVAREVGEAAGGDAHAVEPVLIEPVRRCFKSKMRDAFAGKRIQLLFRFSPGIPVGEGWYVDDVTVKTPFQ